MSNLAIITYHQAAHRLGIASQMRNWEGEVLGEGPALVVLEAYDELRHLFLEIGREVRLEHAGSRFTTSRQQEAAN